MSKRAWWCSVAVMLAVLFAVRPAAADVSVGSNLGFTVLIPSEGGDNVVVVQVPAGPQFLLIGTQPGLRIGISNAERTDEFHLDTGLLVLNGGGDTFTNLQLMGNYQHAFAPAPSGQPYLTGGIGVGLISGGGSSASSFIFGIGVGHRQWVAGGHGSIRGEIRYDRIGEATEEGFTVQSASNSFSMRLGFDLWAK